VVGRCFIASSVYSDVRASCDWLPHTDQATTSNAASSATTSDEDERNFFNFASASSFPSQKYLEYGIPEQKEERADDT